MSAMRKLMLCWLVVLVFAGEAFAIHPCRKPSVLQYTGPNAPPVYGFAVPSTTWGWFGVHYWPTQSWHTGYGGDMREWGYRRGY